jgi:hypothetical protein
MFSASELNQEFEVITTLGTVRMTCVEEGPDYRILSCDDGQIQLDLLDWVDHKMCGYIQEI